MEKTATPHVNGSGPTVVGEPFQFHDTTTGVTLNVREATDEQLAKLLANVQREQNAAQQAANEMLQRSMQALGMLSVVMYEIERRRRSIIIAGTLPPRTN